jgi:ubiquinone/menaquinone biosynthesis C-methylase UbiE
MVKIDDQAYLVSQQYRDGANLAARGAFLERFGTNPHQFHRWLFDHVRIPAQAQILELGCGTGVLWLKNQERIPGGWNITLTDLSAGMLQAAQRELRHVAHPFAYGVVDAQSLPYPDDRFDAVFAHFMLFHVPDRSMALGEIRRVLRPGGRLYAATGSVNNLRELDSLRPAQADDWGRATPFALENGRDQLATWFPHVELHRYRNEVVVTEAEPLTAHLLSKYVASPLDDAARSELVARVQSAIAAQGALRGTWESGLFETW